MDIGLNSAKCAGHLNIYGESFCPFFHCYSCVLYQPILPYPLQWRHNGRDGAFNHRSFDCLLYRLFRRGSKKQQSSASLAFVRGIHRWPVNFSQKEPVTRKMFPCDDVTMPRWQHDMETLSALLPMAPFCGKSIGHQWIPLTQGQ